MDFEKELTRGKTEGSLKNLYIRNLSIFIIKVINWMRKYRDQLNKENINFFGSETEKKRIFNMT